MNNLFLPLEIRGVEIKNRIAVSPMCMYSAVNGFPREWHVVHLGSRAVGGAGLIIQEATSVSPEARISPDELGIWNDEQAAAYVRVNDFIKSQNCVPGIQLAHAGRKASMRSPLKGSGAVTPENGGWQVLGPSADAFSSEYPVPKEMTIQDIKKVIGDFTKAAERSVSAGFKIIELHMAHGYLVHQFYSPLSNKRTDEYGGSFENRTRLAVEIARSVRNVLPAGIPLFVRISSTDWTDGGWTIDDSVRLSGILKKEGVDLIDCSSGGNVPAAKIPLGPGYQISFAERIKKETGILVGGVGLITSPEQADMIIRNGQADIVLLGREFLREPYWPLKAARALKVDAPFPKQYERAK